MSNRAFTAEEIRDLGSRREEIIKKYVERITKEDLVEIIRQIVDVASEVDVYDYGDEAYKQIKKIMPPFVDPDIGDLREMDIANKNQ